MAQLVRAPPCHGGGHGFEPHSGRLYEAMNKFHTKIKNGVLAQLGEHLPYKQRVIGSSPIGPIYRENGFYLCSTPMWLNSRQLRSEASQL